MIDEPRTSSNPELGEYKYKESVGSCPRVLPSFSCFPRFSLVLDHRGRLGGKIRSACEEYEDNEGGIYRVS